MMIINSQAMPIPINPPRQESIADSIKNCQRISPLRAPNDFLIPISFVRSVTATIIMNIMMVAVTERTKEIGIRKSLGARKGDILWQFLIESAMLSCLGGFIGIGIAWLLMIIMRAVTPVPFAMPLWSVISALTVSTVVGLVFGVYPAWKAAKLDPIEALRYD